MSLNMKSNTKQEIFDEYMKIKKKLDEVMASKYDPVAEAETTRKAEVVANADGIVSAGIFAPEIVKKYQDICEAITIKEKTLSEMYGIEAEANSMVALVNAHKDKEQELTEKYEEMKVRLLAEHNEKKKALEEEIEQLKLNKAEILKSTRQENDDIKAALAQAREREEEEYEYNKARAHKIADDQWEDEKAAREKALAAKEIEVADKETVLSEKLAKAAELEEKVAGIPALVEEAYEKGKKDGKADAEKSHVFETRSINQKNEYEVKSLTDQVERLKSEVASLMATNASLQDKLDKSYAQMRDLATETVKSSGGVKVISTDRNEK